VAHVVVAVAVFLAQATRQRGENAEAGEWQQPAVRDLVQAVAVRVITAKRQTADLLGCGGLQTAVVAARAGAKLVDAGESLVERSIVSKGLRSW
jgi:hypothetical protein